MGASPNNQNRTRRSRQGGALLALGLIGGLFALAMWGKMRFVTDLPRVAYADPKAEKVIGESPCCEACADEMKAQPADEMGESPDPESLEATEPAAGEF